MSSDVEDFLQRLNAHLPEGVDWKQGAVTYLRDLVREGGPAAERFHFTKPFSAGPDFGPFFIDAFYFLDVLQQLDLPPRSRVLDVGCGPGWTIQWLCKLGHTVIGLDISPDLLEIAAERMATDPYPPFVDEPFRYELRLHDIEDAPLGLVEPLQCALFESTLHHFYDPVSALRNVSADLTDDGVIAVIEASAPPLDSTWHRQNVDLMERFHTIERPYSREQLCEMLELAGLPYFDLRYPLNRLVSQDEADALALAHEVVHARHINILFASRTARGLARIGLQRSSIGREEAGPAVEYGAGFHGVERRPDGTSFRWAEPRAVLRVAPGTPVTLRLGAAPRSELADQTVRVMADGKPRADVRFDRRRRSGDVTAQAGADGLLELHCDKAFSPSWRRGSDPRLLAFTIEV